MLNLTRYRALGKAGANFTSWGFSFNYPVLGFGWREPPGILAPLAHSTER